MHRLQYLRHMGSVVAVPRLEGTGSVVAVHGLSCFKACGIFLDQGLNLCLLHWQPDSLPLSHPLGFPGGASGKEPTCQCRRHEKHRFDPWEDPLEEEMATHSGILAWRILWTEEPGGLQSMGWQGVGHD